MRKGRETADLVGAAVKDLRKAVVDSTAVVVGLVRELKFGFERDPPSTIDN